MNLEKVLYTIGLQVHKLSKKFVTNEHLKIFIYKNREDANLLYKIVIYYYNYIHLFIL